MPRIGAFHGFVFVFTPPVPLDTVAKYLTYYRKDDLPFGITYTELGHVIGKTAAFTQPLASVFDNGSGTCVALR